MGWWWVLFEGMGKLAGGGIGGWETWGWRGWEDGAAAWGTEAAFGASCHNLCILAQQLEGCLSVQDYRSGQTPPTAPSRGEM